MPSFYASLAAVATRLLTDRGQQVTFTRAVDGAFDPATGITTPGTPTTITGYGASFDYNRSEIDGTLIKRGDIRFIFEAAGRPKEGDTVVIDSETYRVMAPSIVSPAGVDVYYEVQLRI